MLLVHNSSNDHVRPHHNRSENLHSTPISASVLHPQLQESASIRRLFVHYMALRQRFHRTISLFPHVGLVGPEISILQPLPRFPEVSRGNYYIQSGSGCSHSLPAVAHDMGPEPFNSEEVRSQRCISAGKFVSFCLLP